MGELKCKHCGKPLYIHYIKATKVCVDVNLVAEKIKNGHTLEEVIRAAYEKNFDDIVMLFCKNNECSPTNIPSEDQVEEARKLLGDNIMVLV